MIRDEYTDYCRCSYRTTNSAFRTVPAAPTISGHAKLLYSAVDPNQQENWTVSNGYATDASLGRARSRRENHQVSNVMGLKWRRFENFGERSSCTFFASGVRMIYGVVQRVSSQCLVLPLRKRLFHRCQMKKRLVPAFNVRNHNSNAFTQSSSLLQAFTSPQLTVPRR